MRPNFKPLNYSTNLSLAVSMCTLLLFLNNSVAQSTATVYTPEGTPVTVWVLAEMTQSQISATNAQAIAAFPNATIISNSSAKYNCHGYAWYLTECTGCPKYWMDTPGDDKYWQDCSYVEVSAAQAQKISYTSDDHSAVKSVVSGKYDSKWGQWPVMRHSPTYTPYVSTNLKYYARPQTQILGSNVVCFSATYSLSAYSGSVNWSTTNSSIATINSSGVLTKTGNGNVAVKATITVSGGCSYVVTKNIWVGKPDSNLLYFERMQANSPHTLLPYGMSPIVVTHGYLEQDISSFNWSMAAPWWNVAPNGIFINVDGSSAGGSLDISIQATNPCGTCSFSNPTTFTVIGGYYFSIFPNPSTETLTIQRKSKLQDNSLKTNTNLEKSFFKLYDYNGDLVVDGEIKDLKRIDVSMYKKGMYFLKIVSGLSEDTHRLIIN